MESERGLAQNIAAELDRLALLHGSNGLRPMTDAELEPVVAGIRAALGAAPAEARSVKDELAFLLQRVGEMNLDEGFNGHYKNGFEMCRARIEAVLSRLSAERGERNDI